jgi:hypothetical protein
MMAIEWCILTWFNHRANSTYIDGDQNIRKSFKVLHKTSGKCGHGCIWKIYRVTLWQLNLKGELIGLYRANWSANLLTMIPWWMDRRRDSPRQPSPCHLPAKKSNYRWGLQWLIGSIINQQELAANSIDSLRLYYSIELMKTNSSKMSLAEESWQSLVSHKKFALYVDTVIRWYWTS